jgi:predicted nucleic acid-binding protein
MYKQLAESAKGVSHAGRLVIPAARSVMVQMMMAVELFSVEVLSLDRGVVMEQLRQVDLQLKGVRAADSLHITSAIVSGAEIIVSGDDDMLKLDQQFRTPNGGIIRCLDTDIVLATLSEDSSPDQG